MEYITDIVGKWDIYVYFNNNFICFSLYYKCLLFLFIKEDRGRHRRTLRHALQKLRYKREEGKCS